MYSNRIFIKRAHRTKALEKEGNTGLYSVVRFCKSLLATMSISASLFLAGITSAVEVSEKETLTLPKAKFALAQAEPSPKKAKTHTGCRLITTQQAIKRANAKLKGKIVSIKLDKKGEKSVYRVRVLVGKKRIKNLVVSACKRARKT